VAAAMAELRASELLDEMSGRYRLAPSGRTELERLLAAERAEIDDLALARLYEQFDSPITTLKQLASAWQIRGIELLRTCHGVVAPVRRA